MKNIKSLRERFMEKIGNDWQWAASKTKYGYGDFWTDGKHKHAHRVSYELFNGPIPPGMDVLHDCDDRGCVNPGHLHLGNDKMNAQEREQRGRGKRPNIFGDAHWNTKLTDRQVVEIRELYTTKKFSQRELGIKFNVARSTIEGIVIRTKRKRI